MLSSKRNGLREVRPLIPAQTRDPVSRIAGPGSSNGFDQLRSPSPSPPEPGRASKTSPPVNAMPHRASHPFRSPAKAAESARPVRSLPRSSLDASAGIEATGPDSPKLTSAPSGNNGVSFGPFKLFPEERLLLEAEKPVRVGSRALDILITMVERANQLVSKEDLMARVWPNLHVEPANLTVHIAALRRLLGDGRNGNRYLVNIPGRGYRFVAAVSRLGTQPPTVQSLAVGRCNNLPARVKRLVGRSEALDVLAAQLAERRLISIVGPGGIGKTSVAHAVADNACENYQHGVWQIDLACLEDGGLISGAISSTLGFTGSDVNMASLVDCLRDKQMLLVFDSCEHVVEAAALAATAILRGAPGVQILATSREPLRAEGEHRFRLPPLRVPASEALTAQEALGFSAVDLFVECVAAKLEDFNLTDGDVPFIIDLCRRLDAIPLAIEFAASAVDTFGIRGMARRLQGGLPSLTGGYRTAVPRQQSLRAMLDWSYDWLSEPERIILCRISILDGDFTIEHAIAVGSNDDIGPPGVVDCLASLVSKSLVAADIAGAEPSYRLFETTRAFALEKLQGTGENEIRLQ